MRTIAARAGRPALAAAAVLAAVVMAGCASQRSTPDLEPARQFRGFPLYWAGERFEKWNLSHVEGVDAGGVFVSFMYGTCTPTDGEQPSCTAPFEIQVSPLCSHLDVVARSPVWKTRQVRGAPVGANPDGAPVLFSRGAQVKVYRGEGSDAGLPLRVLHALRSINDVRPVVAAGDVIPAPSTSVLESKEPCRTG